jgi:hypothetical protein
VSCFDWDDHCEANDAMPWMVQLKELNPSFKATLFSIPALGSDDYWDDHPEWIELVGHGWAHPDPREAEHWDHDQATDVLLSMPRAFVDGWKSPGWLTSDGMYQACLDLGWWIADQHLADARRPAGLAVYLHEDGRNWHGHVQNVCGNGLRETWAQVCEMVEETDEFLFASEAVQVAMPA